MAEEQKNPEEEQSQLEQEIEDAKNSIDDDLPEFVDNAEEVVADFAETIDQKMDDAQEAIEAGAAKVVDAVSSDDTDIDEQVEDVLDDAEDTLEDAAEQLQRATEDKQEVMAVAEEVTRAHGDVDHHYSDDVVIPYFGHIGTMPGGIYTFVFFVLAALTVIEVLITFIGENAFTIAILVIFSVMKAVLVIMYYMHLKDDNPIYRWVVILPLLIVLLSTLYLLGVPAGAGLGYN